MQSFRVRCTSCRPLGHRRRSSWDRSCSLRPSRTCPGLWGSRALQQTSLQSWRQVRSFSTCPSVCRTSTHCSQRRLGRNCEWGHKRRDRWPKTLWSRSRQRWRSCESCTGTRWGSPPSEGSETSCAWCRALWPARCECRHLRIWNSWFRKSLNESEDLRKQELTGSVEVWDSSPPQSGRTCSWGRCCAAASPPCALALAPACPWRRPWWCRWGGGWRWIELEEKCSRPTVGKGGWEATKPTTRKGGVSSGLLQTANTPPGRWERSFCDPFPVLCVEITGKIHVPRIVWSRIITKSFTIHCLLHCTGLMRNIKARIYHFMLLLKQAHFCILFSVTCFLLRLTMSTNGPFMSGNFVVFLWCQKYMAKVQYAWRRSYNTFMGCNMYKRWLWSTVAWYMMF